MSRGVISLVALFAAIPAVGCGTLLNQSPPGSYFGSHDRRQNRLYGGVRTDSEMLVGTVVKAARGEPVSSSSTTGGRDPVTGEWVERDTTPVSTKVRDAITMTLFFAADLPLSFVTDTVLLPWDIRYQWRRLTGRTPPNPYLKDAEPTPVVKSTQDTPPPAEGSLTPPAKPNSWNPWQVSRRVDLPLTPP